MLTRRTATVTISAPLSSTAARVSAKSLYFPVPTISRDLNDFPPRSKEEESLIFVSGIFVTANLVSSAADEIDYLDVVARLDDGRGVAGLGDNLAIDLDCDTALARVEALEQRAESKVAVDGIRITVEDDGWHRGVTVLGGHRKRRESKSRFLAGKRLGCGSNAAPLASLRRHYPDQVRGVLHLELSVRFTHTPSLNSFIQLAGQSVKIGWSQLLADVFGGASSLVDHLFNRVAGVARRLIELFTIAKTPVTVEGDDCVFYLRFDLVIF
jgi:hypothetical protein